LSQKRLRPFGSQANDWPNVRSTTSGPAWYSSVSVWVTPRQESPALPGRVERGDTALGFHLRQESTDQPEETRIFSRDAK